MSDELLARVRQRWKIDQIFPEPFDALLCPCCRSTNTHIRSWKYHERPESEHPPRCDVGLKCHDCSMYWGHGVPVPVGSYPPLLLGVTIHHGRDSEAFRATQQARAKAAAQAVDAMT